MRALSRERPEMMHFEVTCLAATLTAFIHVRATPAISLVHLAALSRGNVSTTRSPRIGRLASIDDVDALARRF